jgi:hypothetical protein
VSAAVLTGLVIAVIAVPVARATGFLRPPAAEPTRREEIAAGQRPAM